jgi:class 3 adenylate cyclase
MRRGKDGYEGMGVHTAARISAQAQGDEILASRETVEQIDRALPVTERQAMNLKGIAIPVEVAAIEWAVSQPLV